MGGRRVGCLQTRMGRERCIGTEARRTRLNNGGILAGGAQIGSHSVGKYGISRRSSDTAKTASEMKAAKSIEPGERE